MVQINSDSHMNWKWANSSVLKVFVHTFPWNWTYDLNFDCVSYRDFSYRINITLVWTTRFTSITKGKLGNLALDKCLVLFSTWVFGESWLFHTTNCLYAQRRCSCQCSTCFRDVLHPRPGSTKALHRCCAIRTRWRRYRVMRRIQIAGRGHNGIQIPLQGYGYKGRRKKLMKRNCLCLLTLVSMGLNASCEIHHVRISNYVFVIASGTISLLMRQYRCACNGTEILG